MTIIVIALMQQMNLALQLVYSQCQWTYGHLLIKIYLFNFDIALDFIAKPKTII